MNFEPEFFIFTLDVFASALMIYKSFVSGVGV